MSERDATNTVVPSEIVHRAPTEPHSPSRPSDRVPAGPSGASTDERLIQLWLPGKSATTRKAYEVVRD